MYSFRNDYSEGAPKRVMDAITSLSFKQNIGYGLDDICELARNTIRDRCECMDSEVHFLVGGTQTNLTLISAALRPYEAVIACHSGHINVHETGSIEATGHKVCIMEAVDGKVTVDGIKDIVTAHQDEHMVKPAMVYLSNSTEIGTIYTLAEIKAIRECCNKHHLTLFLDGARLGAALCAKDNDITLPDLAKYCDAFYIGGTKNGALFGEALVIINKEMKKDFRYSMKQKGGMLAKGFLLGVQFQELLKDDLFFALARHANECAQRMADVMKEANIPFYCESSTNQIFPIFNDELLDKVASKYAYQVQEKITENQTCVRFVTSWATPPHVIDEFIKDFIEWTK